MEEDQPPSQEEYEDHIDKLVEHIGNLEKDKTHDKQTLAASSYVQKDGNLIAYQLDTPELLQKLERFYRGDYLHSTDDGGVVWRKQKDKDLIPLNQYGVSLLMEAVTKYIDKNTTLSAYKEERIYEILGDLGDELTLVIYCNYEKMGMDNYFKKTKFRLIVTTTLHIIESTYRRALDGQTSRAINESRIVTQSDTIGRPHMPMAIPKKRLGFMNPRNW